MKTKIIYSCAFYALLTTFSFTSAPNGQDDNTLLNSHERPAMVAVAAAAPAVDLQEDVQDQGPVVLNGFTLAELQSDFSLLRDAYQVIRFFQNMRDATKPAQRSYIAQEIGTIQTRLEQERQIQVFERFQSEASMVVMRTGDEFKIFFGGAGEGDQATCFKFFGTFDENFSCGRTHRGFLHRVQKSWDEFYERLFHIAKKEGRELTDYNFTFVGHSMGGALSSLYANRLAKRTFDYKPGDHIRLVTYGSPRVFDFKGAAEFESMIGSSAVRVVHEDEDLVPSLPTGANGSRHVGRLLLLPKPTDNPECRPNSRPCHKYPAYRLSMGITTEEHLIRSQSHQRSGNIVGSIVSGVKSGVGLLRRGIYYALSSKPIEQRLTEQSETDTDGEPDDQVSGKEDE